MIEREGETMPAIRRIAASAAMVAAALPFAGAASAQDNYPNRLIRLILPYAPGGSTSVVARLIGQKLTESWGQQVLVDNRPGGNTIIGSEAMIRAAPDGYTLLFVTSTHTVNPSLLKTPYDAVKDFAPITTLTRSPFGLVVHPSLPVKSLREFITLAKSRPRQIDYASSGIGTANHLALELFSMLAGIEMNHVPYKGGGPAMIDLIGGQVQVHMNIPVNLIPNIKAGRIKGLAVTGDSRLSALPQLPTFAEAGLPAFDLTNWNGILAPAATPKPIVDKLAAELARILRTPEMRDKLHAQGQNPWSSTPEQFAALIRSEIDRFAKVVKKAGIKAD
jgi:tripartite-type tricarboxylate transporter receptor subunit TctC